MKPSKKFLGVMRITRGCAAACGADVADENYKVNWVTYLVATCITIYFIFSTYTVIIKFSESWTILLEAFCMVGSVLQGISKLLSGIVYARAFHLEYKNMLSIYLDHEGKGDSYATVLNRCITRLQTILKSAFCIYLVIVLSFIAVPLVILFATGKRLMAMQFYVPYIDPETNFGYFATLGVQSTCLVFGGFGNFAGDMFMLTYFGHIGLFVDIFQLMSEELNDLALKGENEKTIEKLKDVAKWHQKYSGFTEMCDKLFFWISFTQITTSGLSIVLTLCILFTGDWPGAYAYLFLAFGVMYLYCAIGTVVEIANDSIVDTIYAIHWYELMVPQRKIVAIMLMKSQSPKNITVGGVAPLSMNTGLQVTKTVYSIFMMLLNFFS